MRINGAIEIFGKKIIIDVQAPDDENEIIIINKKPDQELISKSDFPIEFLGLSVIALAELKNNGFISLGDIVVNGEIASAINNLGDRTIAEVKDALSKAQEFMVEIGNGKNTPVQTEPRKRTELTAETMRHKDVTTVAPNTTAVKLVGSPDNPQNIFGEKVTTNSPIDVLDVKEDRIVNLRHNGINTIGELTSKSLKDLKDIEGIGDYKSRGIRDALKKVGFSLKPAE